MVKKTDDSYYHVRGAIYIPSRAYNAYQMWDDMNQNSTFFFVNINSILKLDIYKRLS